MPQSRRSSIVVPSSIISEATRSVLAKSLLLLTLFLAIPALAQVEPPARVGRVSLVSLAEAGARVMLADVEENTLEDAVASLQGGNLPEVRRSATSAITKRSNAPPRVRSMLSERFTSCATICRGQ